MIQDARQNRVAAPLAFAADQAIRYRSGPPPLHPSADADALRDRFCTTLPEGPRDGTAVLSDLIAAAEPGLVGNTCGGFHGWVMGGSNPVGVAAVWLTAAWGQNAAISPNASVGFVTGATMAAFTALAAARTEVLARVGYDFEALGLQNAPSVKIFLSDDAHITNVTALRHLGFGAAHTIPIASDSQGCLSVDTLETALSARLWSCLCQNCALAGSHDPPVFHHQSRDDLVGNPDADWHRCRALESSAVLSHSIPFDFRRVLLGRSGTLENKQYSRGSAFGQNSWFFLYAANDCFPPSLRLAAAARFGAKHGQRPVESPIQGAWIGWSLRFAPARNLQFVPHSSALP